MCKAPQWLLVLVAFFISDALFAQANITIDIRGVNSQLEANVRQFLSIEQHKNHPLLSEGRLRRLHTKAPQEIAQALQPYGYYRANIKTELTHTPPEQWQATYTIDPGPPLLISEFKLVLSETLKTDSEFQDLVQNLNLGKGEVFSHVEYESIKTSLTRLAAEHGYFNAHFIEHRVEIDLEVYEARVHLHYDGGHRYLFGDVHLQQNVLEPALLQKYIPFEQGDPYTLSALIDLQQALNDSDYFRTVEVSPDQARSETKDVPVNITLTPRKPHRYTMGLGYGTDTGARARFGWEMPRLNPAGHRINTEARVSEIGYSLGAQYRVPVLNPRTDQMVYSAGIVKETTDTSDSILRTIGASLNRSRGLWRESIAINYQQEEYTIADDHGDSTLLMPGISWRRIWGEGFIYTIDGLRFDINLRGASEKLISDTDFFQVQSGIKAITSINQKNRFIARGRLGSTWTDRFHQLPSSVRFFAGGAQSVRGYSYQSLGPVNQSGEVIGGKHLMIGSLEYEHSLNGKWGLALFYDAGNAIDNLEDKLERGAGMGIRWKSPIGAVRIDLASAVSRDGNPWRIHINIGPDL
ncbi:MAG: autotransporter assembly complex protein TamA [Gammaproteobacteria bacterium]|nr:autotransporter assembly complex protein TamA [Gammaproteobacteria bacterium]